MARFAIGLLAAGLLGLGGCSEQLAPGAAADEGTPGSQSARVPLLRPPGPDPPPTPMVFDPDAIAPREDPWKVWRRQNAQSLHEWVLSLQARSQIEFTAFDHRRLHGLAPLLEHVPYSYYLLVVGDYPLMGEMQALLLFSNDVSMFPYANVVRFAQPPTAEQLNSLENPRLASAGAVRPRTVWVDDHVAAAGGPVTDRLLTSPWNSSVYSQVEAAGDHALIAAQSIDSSFRSEASQRILGAGLHQPPEIRWLSLQTNLSAVVTVADVDPQLRVELRLHPRRPEETATVARELQSLLHEVRARWPMLEQNAYEQQHQVYTDPLLWELVQHLLNEAQVQVESDGTVTAHWTASASLRQRLLDEAPAVLSQLRGRTYHNLRRQQITTVLRALVAYMGRHGDTFPRDICDASGNPLLSWRVELLPFMNNRRAQTVYQQLHRNEAWDSPHNAALLALLPPGLFAASPDTPGGYADILAVRGPGIGFLPQPGQPPLQLGDLPDGLAHTALLVEAAVADAVPVGKPGDLDWHLLEAARCLGPAHADHFYAAVGDGRLVAVPKDCDRAVLAAMLGRADGLAWQVRSE